MRTCTKVAMMSVLFLSLSVTAYAEGPASGTPGSSAGQRAGTGMPNASGAAESMSGASGSSAMGTGADPTPKHKKQKKGTMDSPPPGVQ
jgi:hypothetical protein